MKCLQQINFRDKVVFTLAVKIRHENISLIKTYMYTNNYSIKYKHTCKLDLNLDRCTSAFLSCIIASRNTIKCDRRPKPSPSINLSICQKTESQHQFVNMDSPSNDNYTWLHSSLGSVSCLPFPQLFLVEQR